MSRDELIDELRARVRSLESAGGAQRRGSERASALRGDAFSDAAAGTEGVLSVREDPKRETDSRAGQADAAFKKIVALVNVSDRSVHATRDRLFQAGFPQDAIDEAIERSLEYGLLDDERFARVLIRSRLSQGKGSVGIERELASHDINVDAIEGWPYEFAGDEDAETQRALELLASKPPRAKNRREAAFRKLVSKGYAVSVASRAARRFCELEDPLQANGGA